MHFATRSRNADGQHLEDWFYMPIKDDLLEALKTKGGLLKGTMEAYCDELGMSLQSLEEVVE